MTSYRGNMKQLLQQLTSNPSRKRGYHPKTRSFWKGSGSGSDILDLFPTSEYGYALTWRIYQRPMSINVYFFSGMLVIGNVIIIGWLVYFLLLLLRHLQNVFFRTWCDWCLSPKNYFWNSTFPLRKFSDYNWGGAGMAIQHWIMTHEVWPFICWKNHHIHNTLLGRRIAHRQPTSRHHVICTVNQACIIALGIVGCWKLITS